MILNHEQVIAILHELRNQTLHHGMYWYAESGKVWIDLPNRTTVELSKADRGGLLASIKRGDDEILGRAQFSEEQLSADVADVKTLYEAASGAASKAIYAEIINSIKLTGSLSGAGGQTSDRADGLPHAQALNVLKKMAGRWILDDSRRRETVVIQEDGQYFLEGKIDPTFHLVILAVNPEKNAAEVAKDTPAGRRSEIETLFITPNSMRGHAKGDGHKVLYTKIK